VYNIRTPSHFVRNSYYFYIKTNIWLREKYEASTTNIFRRTCDENVYRVTFLQCEGKRL
jgi:hypothetical protein